MTWKRLSGMIAVVAVVAFSACGDDDDGTGASGSIEGTYNLQTVNGLALPFVVQTTNPKIELTAEQLIVGGGAFTINTTKRTTPTTGAVTNETTTDSGTYTTSGSTTTFKFKSGNTATATTSGSKLTLIASGSASVYAK